MSGDQLEAFSREKEQTITRLKEDLKPGDTIWTITRHCSDSGTYRAIDVYTFEPTDTTVIKDQPSVTKSWLTYSVAIVINYHYDLEHKAIGVVRFKTEREAERSVVDELSLVLFGERGLLRQETI